jgi:hypothetical protein
LVSGGNGKDAIRNALLMGVGVTALPGMASGIQQSGFGKSITGGLANIFGAGADQVSGPQQSAAAYFSPPPRPAGMTSISGPAMAPASAEEDMARTGVGTPGDRQSPMTTIPSLRDMASQDPLFAGARGFESRMGLPPDLDEYLNRMDLQDMASRRQGLRGFAMGGEIEGPGTGTSDSIPAEIYQDGQPVQKAALSDGEFVMTAGAVKGAGNGSRDRGISRMYELMRRFESGEMV